MTAEPTWGEPPIGEVIAQLLAERWDLSSDDRLRVEVGEGAGTLTAVLASGSTETEVAVTYRSGAGERDPWIILVDALDGLFGQLQEANRDHRVLPSGEGVVFGGAQLAVRVEKHVPELQRLADHLLKSN